jgi:hypothetical protein
MTKIPHLVKNGHADLQGTAASRMTDDGFSRETFRLPVDANIPLFHARD